MPVYVGHEAKGEIDVYVGSDGGWGHMLKEYPDITSPDLPSAPFSPRVRACSRSETAAFRSPRRDGTEPAAPLRVRRVARSACRGLRSRSRRHPRTTYAFCSPGTRTDESSRSTACC